MGLMCTCACGWSAGRDYSAPPQLQAGFAEGEEKVETGGKEGK